MYWVRWDLLLHREVQHSPQSMQSPEGCSLFFQGLLRSSCQRISSCWSTTALGYDCSLLLGTGVQLVVSCTIIEAQIVFETLLVLITSQLAIAGQLGREVHLWNIELLLRNGGWRWLGERVLSGWGCQRCVCLILGGHSRTRGKSFSLLPRVRLKDLFLYLPCMVVFMVIVVAITYHNDKW